MSRAIRFHELGGPEVLRLEEVELPAPGPGQALVRHTAIGVNFGLVSFVVVVLGGLGSMAGALLGGFIIGLVEVVSGFFLATALKQALYFLIFVLVLLLRPQGLFGTRGAETMGFGKLV